MLRAGFSLPGILKLFLSNQHFLYFLKSFSARLPTAVCNFWHGFKVQSLVCVLRLQVISCLAYSLAENQFVAHSVVALIVEVNSVFLHLRKLMQILDIGFHHPLYRLVCLLNLVSFVLCRFVLSLTVATHALIAYRHRMSTFYYTILAPTIAVLWLLNIVLFWRLFTSDVLRPRRRAKHLTDNDHHGAAAKQPAATVVDNGTVATCSNARNKTE